MAEIPEPASMDQLRLESLLQVVRGMARLLILPHNDPDPDALASALALQYLIETLTSAVCTIGYGGLIGRAENRALVKYLDVKLQRVEQLEIAAFDRIALVDSQPGAGNNPLPPGRWADIVLDHHQPFREQTTRASFSDVRLDVNSTSVIMTGYVLAAGLDISPRLATALFYGIETDTMGFERHPSPDDRATYLRLQPLVEVDALFSIQHARVSREYFQSFAATLRAAEIRDRAIVAYLGEVPTPDMVAEMADVLLRLDGIAWVLCLAACGDKLYLSLRSTEMRPNAGQVAQQLVRDLGMAGGHGLVAGGQIPLQGRDRAELAGEVTRRLLEALDLQSVPAEKLTHC